MTGNGLKAALQELNWSQARLARKISVQPNSVTRWIADRDGDVPGPVAAYVDLALQVKKLSMETLSD